MFDMFSDIGIFGDTLMPVMETKKKEEKKEHTSIKKEFKSEYKGPVTIVFDSISQIEIKGKEQYTKEELIDEISVRTNCRLFKENAAQFELQKLKENLYLYRPVAASKYEKGYEGKYLLLESMHVLSDLIPAEKEISAEEVKGYIVEKYGIEVVLHLINDMYVPIPDIKSVEKIKDIKFPVKVRALTLFGENLEITEEDYNLFASNEDTQESLLEEEESGEFDLKVNKEVIEKIIKTLLPEYTMDCSFEYKEEEAVCIVGHKVKINVSKKSPAVKEELYPTDASVSLIFTKMQLNSEMFGGKKEITKKELLKHIGKQYPEYSPERTELLYDKKNKLIIPSFKSGKRGNYCLIENEVYRYEETPIMKIKAFKESIDYLGCVKGSLEYRLPKIPFSILDKIIQYFIRIYRSEGTEAIALIFYDRRKEEYEIYIPNQRATAGYVEFDRDTSLECDESKYLVMEIHSHGKFGAFWSQTDNEDELAHRLYAVVGNVDCFDYSKESIIVRGATGGMHVKSYINDIFDLQSN